MSMRMRTRVIIGLATCIALISLVAIRYRPKWEREAPDAVRRDVVSLTRQRDSLRRIVFEMAATSDLLDGRPSGDIAIGLPTQFVDAIVRRVVVGWFHDVDLRLPRMRVRKTGSVKAKLGILGKRTVGEFVLDVTLDDVHGRLQPGDPTLRFGGDQIRLELPIRVAGGTGVARVNATWISKGLAGPVCGDMTVTRNVTGTVRARDYTVNGRIVLSASEGTVLADPDFPALAIRLFVNPSARSVAALDSVLASRGGLCGYAVDRSNASERIQSLVARGFVVRIPQRFFRSIRLPVAVETSVPVQDRQLRLGVTASGLAVTNSTVWMAANVATPGPANRAP